MVIFKSNCFVRHDQVTRMPPSLRFTHPTGTTPQPNPSTILVPPICSIAKNVPATPFDEASQSLRFNARVPMAGMHSSNHTSDAVRTEIHLSSSNLIDVEPFEKIEFDGIVHRNVANSRHCSSRNGYSTESRR